MDRVSFFSYDFPDPRKAEHNVLHWKDPENGFIYCHCINCGQHNKYLTTHCPGPHKARPENAVDYKNGQWILSKSKKEF